MSEPCGYCRRKNTCGNLTVGKKCKCYRCRLVAQLKEEAPNLTPTEAAFVKLVSSSNDIKYLSLLDEKEFVVDLDNVLLYTGTHANARQKNYEFWTTEESVAKNFGPIVQKEPYSGRAISIEKVYKKVQRRLSDYKNIEFNDPFVDVVAEALGNHSTEYGSYIVKSIKK